MAADGRRPVIAIIGGGFTGAAIAFHLSRLLGSAHQARIVVVEPRPTLGAGVAYGTEDPAYRINVPASRMSLEPDRPAAFENWLKENGAEDDQALLPDGRSFPQRAAFGRYMADSLAPALRSGRVEHRRARVQRVDAVKSRYRLSMEDGSWLDADFTVIATTHPPPEVPELFSRALEGDDRLIADASLPGALDSVGIDERVLIVGTGLTMADIVASLEAQGHRGLITAFSRRGQLPAAHPAVSCAPYGDFLSGPSRSARALVQRLRQAVAEAEREGLPPQAVFDAVRAQGRGIWQALPLAERRRVVRHLRPFWDARRFRIAPQLQSVLERRRAEGRFTSLAARSIAVRGDQNALLVSLARRAAPHSLTLSVDRVIIATGPAHQSVLRRVPYLASLASAGLIAPDEVGLGLKTDLHGRAVGRTGVARETLRIGGPLARGTFGELMGLPEVALYAVELARGIARWAVTAASHMGEDAGVHAG